jgi:hypothetical protein
MPKIGEFINPVIAIDGAFTFKTSKVLENVFGYVSELPSERQGWRQRV